MTVQRNRAALRTAGDEAMPRRPPGTTLFDPTMRFAPVAQRRHHPRDAREGQADG